MSEFPLLAILAIGTMVIVIALAMWSRKAALKKKADDDAEKSSLAKDGPGPQPFR